MNVPEAIKEAVQGAPLDKSAALWHVLEKNIDSFRKDKRFGSVNLLFQAGKLVQLEVRDTYKPAN